MDRNVANQFREAVDAYLNETENTLEPECSLLPYDFDFIRGRKWHIFGDQMVLSELRELTNVLNRWHGDLQSWHAWNNVLSGYDEQTSWNVRREFVEALVHQCLLEPSAVRDRFTFVATNALHQVRISSEKDYVDRLEGDPRQPGDRPLFLSRRRKEKRLARLASVWEESKTFLELLSTINGRAYQSATYDYRNRVNHALGPRLALGMTQIVTRSVVQSTEMREQPDGTYREELIPGKLSVSYGIGGTPPIDLEEARELNLKQYQLARTCYIQLLTLLKSTVEGIDSSEKNT